MVVNRIPGEKMYIDWVGDQPELLTDTETGEIKKVHIFATTLGVSSLIYAEAFPNDKLPCFIEIFQICKCRLQDKFILCVPGYSSSQVIGHKVFRNSTIK